MPTSGYTVKELVQELRDDNKASIATQASILKSLENIDRHLQTLNGKVASHVIAIAEIQTEHTKVRAYAGATKFYATAVSMFIGAVWTAVNFIYK